MPTARRGLVAAALVAAIVCVASGCGGTSATSELARDPSDETIAAPPPTAPSIDPNAGLSATGVDMFEQLAALTETRDLCDALGSEAFARLLTDDFDTTALVTSPAGVTRIVAEVNSTFTHLVTIAPAELTASFEVINDAWRRIVLVNPNLPDAAARVQAISEEPQLSFAQETVGGWLMLNCSAELGR